MIGRMLIVSAWGWLFVSPAFPVEARAEQAVETVLTRSTCGAHDAGLAQQAKAVSSDEAVAFQRVASFRVFENPVFESETIAEIVAATPDGRVLIDTDSATGSVGFVDITGPGNPMPLGSVEREGDPRSVAVAAQFAYAAVDTSGSFVNPN